MNPDELYESVLRSRQRRPRAWIGTVSGDAVSGARGTSGARRALERPAPGPGAQHGVSTRAGRSPRAKRPSHRRRTGSSSNTDRAAHVGESAPTRRRRSAKAPSARSTGRMTRCSSATWRSSWRTARTLVAHRRFLERRPKASLGIDHPGVVHRLRRRRPRRPGRGVDGPGDGTR